MSTPHPRRLTWDEMLEQLAATAHDPERLEQVKQMGAPRAAPTEETRRRYWERKRRERASRT